MVGAGDIGHEAINPVAFEGRFKHRMFRGTPGDHDPTAGIAKLIQGNADYQVVK